MFQIFQMSFEMFSNKQKWGRECLKIRRTEKLCGILALLKVKIKRRKSITKQIPDVPPLQKGVSEPIIRELTGIYAYLFYPNFFPSQINLISPLKLDYAPKLIKRQQKYAGGGDGSGTLHRRKQRNNTNVEKDRGGWQEEKQ